MSDEQLLIELENQAKRTPVTLDIYEIDMDELLRRIENLEKKLRELTKEKE